MNADMNSTQVLQWTSLSAQVQVHQTLSRTTRALDRRWRVLKFLARVWFDGYSVDVTKKGWSVSFQEPK